MTVNQPIENHADPLAGTTAIVTGVSRGFGRAIAAALAEAGAHVVGVARGSAQLEELHDELGDSFSPVTADAADPDVANRLIDQHRPSVLVLNAVAPMASLADIEEQVPALVQMDDFNAGQRYADFNKGTAKVAAYGLAALVAGGIAAKAGLFKVLWVGLLAFKKFVIIGFIAAAGFIKKLFGRKPPAPAA